MAVAVAVVHQHSSSSSRQRISPYYCSTTARFYESYYQRIFPNQSWDRTPSARSNHACVPKAAALPHVSKGAALFSLAATDRALRVSFLSPGSLHYLMLNAPSGNPLRNPFPPHERHSSPQRAAPHAVREAKDATSRRPPVAQQPEAELLPTATRPRKSTSFAERLQQRTMQQGS